MQSWIATIGTVLRIGTDLILTTVILVRVLRAVIAIRLAVVWRRDAGCFRSRIVTVVQRWIAVIRAVRTVTAGRIAVVRTGQVWSRRSSRCVLLDWVRAAAIIIHSRITLVRVIRARIAAVRVCQAAVSSNMNISMICIHVCIIIIIIIHIHIRICCVCTCICVCICVWNTVTGRV